MTYRERSRDLRVNRTGTYKYLIAGQWYTVTRSDAVGVNKYTYDEVGEWSEDNPFHSYFYRRSYPLLNGTSPDGSRVFSNFPIDGQHVPQSPESPFAHPAWDAIALDAAARTNPNKPAICLPAFLGELKDLPDLLRSVPEVLRAAGGKYIAGAPRWLKPKGRKTGPIQDLASANLGYQFGWRPFVSDLLQLLDAQRALQAALDVIAQLLAGKSIKRRSYYPLKTAYQDHGTLYTNTIGVTTRHKKETVWYCREWVTTRWSATSATMLYAIPKSSSGQIALGLRMAYGLTNFGLFASAWELLPWSWLIDWFWNLGKWLSANQNFLRLSLDSICWCRTTSSITTFTLVEGPYAGVTLVGDYSTASSLKERHPVNPALALLPPRPSLPALTSGQMSILGSLLAMRGKHAF